MKKQLILCPEQLFRFMCFPIYLNYYFSYSHHKFSNVIILSQENCSTLTSEYVGYNFVVYREKKIIFSVF